MYEQKKCPSCKSPIVKRNSKRKGVQLYKCQACGRQFRGVRVVSTAEMWSMYLHGKQTVEEIGRLTGISASTVKRRLREVRIEWEQPGISGCGVVHIDATYFGRNTGVLLALESGSGRLLYMQHIAHEHMSDYETAVTNDAQAAASARRLISALYPGRVTDDPQYNWYASETLPFTTGCAPRCLRLSGFKIRSLAPPPATTRPNSTSMRTPCSMP